jgi:hypothetical protein
MKTKGHVWWGAREVRRHPLAQVQPEGKEPGDVLACGFDRGRWRFSEA